MYRTIRWYYPNGDECDAMDWVDVQLRGFSEV